MHEKAKIVCFNHMQPHKVKFKSVQINMKHVSYMGLDTGKSVSGGLRTKKSADQPAHPCSLSRTFVIRLLESVICRLARSEISIF